MQELRKQLDDKVRKLMEVFEKVSKVALRSDGLEERDPTLYTGSGGVMYGLYKYILLLK